MNTSIYNSDDDKKKGLVVEQPSPKDDKPKENPKDKK